MDKLAIGVIFWILLIAYSNAASPLFISAITSALATIPLSGGPMTTGLVGAKLGIGTKLLYYLGYFGRKQPSTPKKKSSASKKVPTLKESGFSSQPFQHMQSGGFPNSFSASSNFQNYFGGVDPSQLFQVLTAQGVDPNVVIEALNYAGNTNAAPNEFASNAAFGGFSAGGSFGGGRPGFPANAGFSSGMPGGADFPANAGFSSGMPGGAGFSANSGFSSGMPGGAGFPANAGFSSGMPGGAGFPANAGFSTGMSGGASFPSNAGSSTGAPGGAGFPSNAGFSTGMPGGASFPSNAGFSTGMPGGAGFPANTGFSSEMPGGAGFPSNADFSSEMPGGGFSSATPAQQFVRPQGGGSLNQPIAPETPASENESEDDAESFFTFMQDMDENTCISRLICDIGRDPSFLGEFSENISSMVSSLQVPPTSRAYKYIEIMENGKKEGQCDVKFPECGDVSYEVVKNVAPSVNLPQNINPADINF